MKHQSNGTHKPILFVRSPQLEQMRNPLYSKWNQELASKEIDADSEINLAELVDFSLMNEVFASYLEVIGLPVAIIDFNGKVLASSNWQRLCMEFHRVNPGTLARCLESDTSLARQMQEDKNYAIYRCQNGLTDCASPIVVEGKHIANLFIGQFFLKPPKPEEFEAQCAEFGFDHDSYFKALAEVPIVEEEKVPAILSMLVGFATLLAKQSIAEHRARIAYEDVERQVVERTNVLEETKERLEAAASAGIIGIWDWDVVNNKLIWDSVMYQLYGIREEDFGGAYEAWSATVHPADKAYTEGEIQAALRGEREYAPEFRVIWPDGSIHHLKAVSHTTFDKQGKPLRMIGVNYDLTEQKHIQSELNNLAFYDRLTNLPNRRLLDDRLDQSIARAQRDHHKIALLFIDLDKFKPVNDTHGHEVGDMLLKKVAERIQKCLRASDTVARIGGDEFVVLLQIADTVAEAVKVAEKIRAYLEQPFAMDEGQVLDISSSIGAVIYPDHADNARELLRFGDEAMYKAKKQGRNKVVVFELRALGETPFLLDGDSIIRLNWKPSFACGEPSIDQEHQDLLNSANALLDLAVHRQTLPKQFNQAFDTLLEHVVQHFADEEAILRAHNYKDLSEHVKLHKMLLKRASELRQESMTSGLPIGKLVEFLVTEVVGSHMLKEDKKFFGLFSQANGKIMGE